jgi:hypothetical protein
LPRWAGRRLEDAGIEEIQRIACDWRSMASDCGVREGQLVGAVLIGTTASLEFD